MDPTTSNKIVSFIWGIADDVLRDLFRRGKYPDVILPMCVIRRMDAVLEPTKQAVLETKKMLDEAGITEQKAVLCNTAGQAFYNTSKFTLRDLKSRGNHQQLQADFEDYLNGFSPNVLDILENLKFRNQLSTLSKADALGTLINKFLDPDIDLSPAGIDNHAMGTVFEELVRKFNEENNEEAGEHWTPRDAVQLMANLVFLPIESQLKSGTYLLFDDACGTGGMLKVKHKPFHSYTMKQAVEEHFILDVLKNYTPVMSYFGLVKKVEDDPLFDKNKAKKKLRRYVESHDHAIRLKAEIMVDHFHESVLAAGKIGGQARAMVVCSGIERAIQHFKAFQACLVERKSPYQAIVAFSGEPEYQGVKVSESSLNGFASRDIADKIQDDPYRFLICADKFQTGYDEPLLHTMYVDKALSGIKAVQTLSRLNRAHPKKRDCFVLDFQNGTEGIKLAFQDYYRTTLLSEETDPNKLNDQKRDLDAAQVYSSEQVEQFVALFLAGAERDKLDPILDACVAVYKNTLDEDQQVDFKGKAKAFCRTYDFLSSITPGTNADWEKLSILLNLLVAKLPAPKEEDLAKGIIDTIDMDSYRVDKQAAMKIALADNDAAIDPGSGDRGGFKPQPELDRLSSILKAFNESFGTLFTDSDRMVKKIREEVAPRVQANAAYQNAKQNTPHTARMAHDQALGMAMQILLKDETQIYKQFVENESLKRFVGDMVYALTSQPLQLRMQ